MMKLIKLCCLIFAMITIFSSTATSFNQNEDCQISLTKDKLKSLNATRQKVFDDYTNSNYSIYKNGQYIVCFDGTEFTATSIFTVTSKIDASGNPIPLLIYGLNLKMASAPADPCTSALLTITGAGVTMQSTTLTGPEACTGIKIDGAKVTIDTANISKFATTIETTANSENVSVKNSAIEIPAFAGMTGVLLAGKGHIINTVTIAGSGSGTAIQVNGTAAVENSALSNFTEGIKIAKDASVKLAKNAFTAFEGESGFLNAVLFDAGVISPLDAGLLGKKVSDDNATKVISVTGKLNLDNCSGSAEMYYKYSPADGINSLQLHPTATCAVAPLAEDTKLKFGVQDGEEKEETISKDTCAFKCADFTEDLSTQITFAYTSVDGKTYPFTPMPIKKLSDLPDVISTTVTPPIFTPISPQGVDVDAKVYVQSYESSAQTGDQINAGNQSAISTIGSDEVNVDPSAMPPNDNTELKDEESDTDNFKTSAAETNNPQPTQGTAVGCGLVETSSKAVAANMISPFTLLAGLLLITIGTKFFHKPQNKVSVVDRN